MKSEDTVEYNSLRWVKKELDLILQEAQASLSAYIEDTNESGRLRESVEHLHMVHGTLQMVELYGAAQLAEEMEKVSDALLQGKVSKVDDAYDVLMRSMLQLPDYLESLQSGSKDVPMVLLPLLNDLRASRNASLLSENVLFFPDVESVNETTETQAESGELVSVAKKLRPHFQIGLLGWFKGEKANASLKRILAVLAELEKKSSHASIRRIWSISCALAEGLSQKGIDTNLSIKMLMGQVDRSIKQLVDTDEEVFAENTPDDLLKNLLYYVARISTDSARVNNIKATYRLEELLPGDSELDEVRSGMGGLNQELLSSVSAGIREDLLEVKDALEIFVHSEAQDIARLNSLPNLLSKIADTLSMLGLGMPREQVLDQRAVIEKIISGEIITSDEIILNIAGVLLSVESQLNSFIANRSSTGMEGKVAHRVGDLAEMPESEYIEVLSAVIREALQDFNDARQAILSYLENPTDKTLLEMVIGRLDEVNGAMFMLPIQKLKHQIDGVREYVAEVMLAGGQLPDEQQQNDLADVITSVEYYLEAMLEGRPDIELSMNSGDQAASRLYKITSDKKREEHNELELDSDANIKEANLDEQVESTEIELEIEELTAADAVSDLQSNASAKEEPRYIILSEDADEEILEIFIEEALEELASLNMQVPLWSRDHGNEEAMITIRRSFHTLKGSGRLIGAELIGEFAWNFENMLNRVMDKSRPLNQDVFDILDEALAVLPQLIDQLKGNTDPIPKIYELIDKADFLGQWKNPVKNDKPSSQNAVAAPAKENNEPELEVEDSLEFTSSAEESEPELLDISLDHNIEISEDEVMAEISDDELTLEFTEAEEDSDTSELSFDLSEASESIDDDFDIDLTEELEALHVATDRDDDFFTAEESPEAEVAEPALELDGAQEEETPQIFIDPVLFDIFKGESDDHIQHIREMLSKHQQFIEPLTANADLLRALHTLYGSARTAEVEEIAEICGALEKYVRCYLQREQLEILDSGVTLIADGVEKVSVMLQQLGEKNQPLEADEKLLQRIKSCTQEMHTTALHKTSEPAASERNDDELAASAVTDESLVSYTDVDDELVDIFLEEAEELLDNCENSLQRWNADFGNEESVLDLQRHLHTLKGGARMADLSPVGDLTHALESLVIAVSDKQLTFNKDISNVLHDALDQLSDMLAKVKDRQPILSASRMIAHIEAVRKGKDPASSMTTDEDEDPEPAASANSLQDVSVGELDDADADVFEVELSEAAVLSEDFEMVEEAAIEPLEDSVELIDDSFAEISLDESASYEVELKPEAILDLSDDFERHVSVSLVDEAEITEAIDPEAQIPSSTMLLDKLDDTQAVTGVQAKDNIANEQVRVRSDLLNELVNHAGEVSVYHARMGQQITNFGFNLSEMEQTVVRLREQLRQLSIETEAQILSRYEKESDQYDRDFDPLEMDRFSTMQQISRSLQETVGDIESIKDLLSEEVRDSETLLLQESRVSTELQEGLMRTRMVHFGGLASRLRRIVRQTARELNKDVALEIIGETSEVDRTVLDRIVAPLEHMLRNAVSHGIEKPDERKAAGKSESGQIKVSVDREGGDVVIVVSDDGQGINVAAIRKKATEKGLLDAKSKLSDHDILQYIMEPGFSTAEKVTQISGRGVGMDVVDSEIKQLGGVLEIDTVQGKGTTFTVRLPLTLAINHALLVEVGEEVYAVPLNSIEGVVRLSGPELQQFYDSGEMNYEFAGSSYELKHLGYTLTGNQPDYSRQGQLFPVLLARAGEQSVALHVDELIGRREIVVKPVGVQISSVRGISGATILGDGRVVIILEMNALVLGDSLFQVSSGDIEEDVSDVQPKREKVIMVVDDSITIRKVTERMLNRHDMKVITAKDGVDAISQLQEIMPDVMLLDIEMPRMDGYEVATHIRNDTRLKDLPIIMITSRSGSKHKEKAMEVGVNKYLGKPFQEDVLLKNIHELIG